MRSRLCSWWRYALRFSALRFLVPALLAAACVAHADSGALWHVVHNLCVPNETHLGSPAPCTKVELNGAAADGYAVLKDLVGATQYLLIPTARVTGIEDPLLLRPGTPNYFAFAWEASGYTERAAGGTLPRDAITLAINSRYARSQNQLHIHIDCIRPDVRAALRRQMPAIGAHWAPLRERLVGHRYWAMRVTGDKLDGADPFRLLATGRPAAAASMGRQTLVVAGAVFADGRPGFVLLNDEVNLARRDRASGEDLQDHSCAVARG